MLLKNLLWPERPAVVVVVLVVRVLSLSYVAFELGFFKTENQLKMESRVYIPQVQVRNGSLLSFEIPEPPYNHKRHELKQYKTYTGIVTEHTAKRISASVDVFLQKSRKRYLNVSSDVWPSAVPFRLSFMTLTISQSKPVDAVDGHKALKVFLDHFRAKPAKKAISEQLKSYIWKAELQERGQLHYHITSNTFMHFAEVNRVWNGIQFRRGWLDEYRSEHGHTNAPSTDIKAVYKSKNIGAELTKYLAKTGKKDVSDYGFACTIFEPHINGKVWDCSNDLKVKRYSDELDTFTRTRIEMGIQSGDIQHIRLPRCSVFKTERPVACLSVKTLKEYRKWQIQ